MKPHHSRHDNLEATLNFESMTAESLQSLQSRIDRDPAFAASLGRETPGRDSLVDWVRSHEAIDLPSRADWVAAWREIDRAVERQSAPARGAAWKIIPLWRPLAAVAACFLFLLTLSRTAATDGTHWPIRLAQNVEIDELETADDVTPLIWSSGGADNVSVIWLVDAGG